MFSVLISTYDKDDASLLDEALCSILKQTYKNYEIVIVVDGPCRTELLSVIENYLVLFEEIRIDTTKLQLSENLGLGAALQSGIEHCTYPFIVRMDSDDISVTTRLEQLALEIKRRPDVDVFGSYIEEFMSAPGDLNRVRKVELEHDKIIRDSHVRNPMNHVTVCMRRDTLVACGGYENLLGHEDYFLWLKMIKHGARFHNLDAILVFVRVRDFSSRRSGYVYFQAELHFVRSCLARDYFSFSAALVYLAKRVLIRFSPNWLIRQVYRHLRHHKEA